MAIKIFKRLLTNVITLILTVNIFLSCKQDDVKIATFDGGDVRLNEYLDLYLLSTESKPDKFPDEENLKHLVLRIAIEKMYVLEAKSRKLESDSFFIAGYSKILNNVLYSEYIRREIAAPIVTDSLVRRFYDHYSPQYKMYYIKRPLSPNADEELIQSQNDTINHVYNLLESGESFEEVAKRFSQDTKTRSKGGYIGNMIAESFSDPVIREVMVNLDPFTYSKPIKSNDRYYILYKGEKLEVTVPPFEKAEGGIRRSLYQTYGDDIEKSLKNRFDYLKNKYHYIVDDQHVKDINKKAEKKVSKKYIIIDYHLLSQEDKKSIVARYDSGEIRVIELFARGHKRPGNIYEFRERLDIIARFHLVGKHALELGYDKLPELQPKINNVFEKYISAVLYKYNIKDVIKNKIDSLVTIEKTGKNFNNVSSSLEDEKMIIRRETKPKFDEMLKEKYNFRFVTENFPDAIAKAKKRKEIQISEQSKQNE